jgi:hypothetical protein
MNGRRLLIGFLTGLIFTGLLVVAHEGKHWKLQCDGNICCTVWPETGEIGDCFVVN